MLIRLDFGAFLQFEKTIFGRLILKNIGFLWEKVLKNYNFYACAKKKRDE